LPQIPTIAESGLPGFEVIWWIGFFAPTGTPRPIVEKLNAESLRILRQPDTRDRLANNGMMPGGGTPEELGAFLKSEIAKWAKVVREAKIQAE